MSYNPLNLGVPLGDHPTSPTSGDANQSRQNTTSANPSAHPNAPEPYPSTGPANVPSIVAPGTGSTIENPSTGTARPTAPPLEHTWSAPTTVPIANVAHNPAQEHSDRSGQGEADPSDSDASSTPTLAALNGDHAIHQGIPPSVGGLNGNPLPGSHAYEGVIHEKDHQAGTVGGKTGPQVGDMAREELGVNEKGEYDEKTGKMFTALGPTQSDADPARRIERTESGMRVAHNVRTTTGDDTVTGMGMVPLAREMSVPPAVSPFGGVAPSGVDAEEGLRPLRSHEEEEEREAMRKAKGPDPWAVKFEPGEKINPKNWGVGYRWYLTGIAGLLVLNSTFASSCPSGIIEPMMKYFGISQEVAVLTLSLFVAGYCVGPLLWGPLSESYGRRPMFISSFVVYCGFQVGCALSKNTASILVFRFLGGCFAAAPLTNSGAMLADIWDTDHRGQAMSIFALAPFAGPSIGPIVAGFISVTGTDWRWMYWILAIFSGVCLVIIVLGVPETYAPAILVVKAKKLRKTTGEDRWYAPLERGSHQSFGQRINDILLKPFIMLALEPMLLAVTLYMSFVYGLVYLLFEAYPFVFIINHGFNTGEEGLAFLGFFLGGLTSVIFFMTVIEPRFLKHAAQMAPLPPKPEKRLELCIISGFALAISMFWLGWTSYPSIHWISPVLAGGLCGVGVLGMFVSLFNYIIDVYLWAAASALAATTVVRSIFGAGFPLFATYEKLGTQWASSLLGFLALVMAPIPIVLTIYGPALRLRSKYSPNKAVH